MPVAQPERFDPAHQQLASWAAAMAHPARIAILDLLARRGGCICGAIVDELPLAQATVSQHLKKLKSAGLITGTIEGPRTCYAINAKALLKAKNHLAGWFRDTTRACCTPPSKREEK